MHSHISGTLDRADKLYSELMAEYKRSLQDKHVSDLAVQLTHEVCERLRSVLDRTARRYWETHVAPSLSEADRKAASIYFPIASDQGGLDSILGRWRWKAVRGDHEAVYVYLLALQPFVNQANEWLAVLSDVAVKGKHIDLVPQTRTEQRRTKVSRGSGSVSWTSSVTFSGNVRVMGAQINPATQRVEPTPGVTETIETWVSFVIADHGVNAAGFCKDACDKTRTIATEMADQFGL